MTSRTVSSLLSDDTATANEIARLVERSGADPEAVLREAEARLEGLRRAGHNPDRDHVIWAVQATLDSLEIQNQRPVSAKGDLPENLRRDRGSVAEDGQTTPLQGSGIGFEDIEPWFDRVQGDDLLGELETVIRRYVVLSSPCSLAVALWILHVHALDAADVSPILCISSPVKRCGKTTLQGVLHHLVPRPLPASNISGSALFRIIEKYHPTMLLDEADSYLVQSEDMRNLLNAGVRRSDAYAYRVVGKNHDTRRFSLFGAKAISLIGALPGTLEDRSIVVRLKRRTKNEAVERLRGRHAPEALRPLREKAARWGSDNVCALREREPNIPECLNDRAADFWEPLLAIADLIGGAWPGRARHAATTLSGNDGLPDDSPAVQLLSDLRDALLAGSGRIASRVFVDGLGAMEERPWSTWYQGNPITVNQVAKLLRRFEGVNPKTLRLEQERAKGYDIETCRDAFERYLPPVPSYPDHELLVASSSLPVTP